MFTPFAFIQQLTTPNLFNYLYVGGNYTSYQQPFYNRIIRTDLSGSVDTTFNMGAGFDSDVQCMVIQSDGKIIAGGGFSTYSGSFSNNLVIINTDGTKDTTFNAGGFLGGGLRDIKVQPDGKIVAVGGFTSYSGAARNNIIRINTDGTRDDTFNIGTGFTGSLAGYPKCVAIQSDDKILVSGQMTQYSGSLIGTGILRINTDGTIDTTFNTGVGFNSTVESIDIQSDGKIVVGGGFTTYSGSVATRLARLNDSGSLDTTFNSQASSTVNTVKIQPDGKILVSGQFTSVSGSARNGIARVLSNGQLDTSYNVGTGVNSLFPMLNVLSLDTSGNVYYGGIWTSYSGSTVNRFVKTTPSGAIDNTFSTGSISFNGQLARGFNATVRTVLVSGSKVYMVGGFTGYQAYNINYLVKLDNTGAIDTTFNVGLGPSNTVTSMAVQSDGKLLIAGSAFTTYSGSSATRIARINTNGTLDTTFRSGTGLNSVTYDMKIQPDGKIIAAGAFTTYSGSTNNRIVRINTNGTKDTTFIIGSGSIGNINQLALQPDGKIIAIGAITSYSGSLNAGIVRINTDGTKDTTFNISGGFNNTSVNAIGIQSTGKIVVVGNFTSYSGSSGNRIVRINTDGTKDTTFNIGAGFNGQPAALKVLADDSIIVYGSFTTYSGSAIPRIIKLNTDGIRDTTFAPTTGFIANGSTTGFAQGLSTDKDNNIYVGNLFTTYNGTAVGNIVRMNQLAAYDNTFNQGSFFNGTGIGFNASVASIINITT